MNYGTPNPQANMPGYPSNFAGAVNENPKVKTPQEILAEAERKSKVLVIERDVPCLFKVLRIEGSDIKRYPQEDGSVKLKDAVIFGVEHDGRERIIIEDRSTLMRFYSDSLGRFVRVTKTGTGLTGTRYKLEVSKDGKDFKEVTGEYFRN